MLSFFRVLIILLKGIIPRFASVIHGLACFRGFLSLLSVVSLILVVSLVLFRSFRWFRFGGFVSLFWVLVHACKWRSVVCTLCDTCRHNKE